MGKEDKFFEEDTFLRRLKSIFYGNAMGSLAELNAIQIIRIKFIKIATAELESKLKGDIKQLQDCVTDLNKRVKPASITNYEKILENNIGNAKPLEDLSCTELFQETLVLIKEMAKLQNENTELKGIIAANQLDSEPLLTLQKEKNSYHSQLKALSDRYSKGQDENQKLTHKIFQLENKVQEWKNQVFQINEYGNKLETELKNEIRRLKENGNEN